MTIFYTFFQHKTWESKNAQFTVGVNVLQTAGFMLANEIFWDGIKGLTLIPIHVNAQYRIRPHLSLDFGLVYRYEDYHKKKKVLGYNLGQPVYDPQFGGEINGKPIWVNHHEIFLLCGPRYNANPESLSGFYGSFKLGTGLALSPNYTGWTFLLEPEIGYSWNFGTPGFYLATGIGVLFNLPIYEKPNIEPVIGKVLGTSYLNPVHRAIPILNLTLGMAI